MKGLVLLFCTITSISVAQIDPLNCDLTDYRPQEGLTATVEDEILSIDWGGAAGEVLRMRLAIVAGVPTLRELAVRYKGESWHPLLKDVVPEFRVVSAQRRVTQQQTDPLERLGIPLTAELLDSIKWVAFWDAPLFTADEPPRNHQSSVPATEAFANHPGLPRRPEEIERTTANYSAKACTVRTDGLRLQIIFPGVRAGNFEGHLQFDVFRGTNLIRQMLVVRTERPSVAFKYDAGWAGLGLEDSTRVVWRDLVGHRQEYHFGGAARHPEAVTVKGRNRLIAAELSGGSMAAFPPPHSFYWARESEQNLGYGWYRKDGPTAFSFGIRQAEREEDPEFEQNFALYNARPGTWQHLPVFWYPTRGPAQNAMDNALRFTNGDRFRPLPGYKVMGHHYHVGLVPRTHAQDSPHRRLNDITTMRGIGVDIYGVIDGARGPGRHDKDEKFLADLSDYYGAARHQSDRGFLVMPNDENSTGGRPPFLGGHYDILFSKPTYWRPQRKAGAPLYEAHPEYGTVYNLGTPADMMAMAERENVLISMPHPRAKRSTGYPDAIKDSVHFQHPNYFALGYRWGMGIDASERRLGEYRFLNLWDQTNNWMAARGARPKFALAISESRSDIGHRGKPPYDDAYGMAPVNYVRIDSVPTIDDMSSIIDALKAGDYFVTSGEVLIPNFEIIGEGINRTIVADVEWTFPLDFVEVVWGDGRRTDRQLISTADLPAFGKHRFEIPFDAEGKAWVRFAAWDVATNGAMVQPVHLND